MSEGFKRIKDEYYETLEKTKKEYIETCYIESELLDRLAANRKKILVLEALINFYQKLNNEIEEDKDFKED